MDTRIKFLEGKLKYLQGQLTAQLFNRQTQTLVYHNLNDGVNHVTDRIRHYLVYLHTKCETIYRRAAPCLQSV